MFYTHHRSDNNFRRLEFICRCSWMSKLSLFLPSLLLLVLPRLLDLLDGFIIIIDHLDPVFNLQRTLEIGFLGYILCFECLFQGISFDLIRSLNHLAEFIPVIHSLRNWYVALQISKNVDLIPPRFLHLVLLGGWAFGITDLVLMILRELLNGFYQLGFLSLLHQSFGI